MPTRQGALRKKCHDCSAGDHTAVRCCPVLQCALWGYRMGYQSKRNEHYYNRDIFLEHMDEPQETFNRILKEAREHALETA